MKTKAKRLVPGRLWQAGSRAYWWWYNRGQHQAAGLMSRRRSASIRKLRGLRDSRSGGRCFVVGNGPSLNKMDLSQLQGEVTFGSNRVYLLFPRLGFSTTYYVAINTLVIGQCRADIRALDIPKFVTWRARQWLSDDPGCIFLDTDYRQPASFSRDVSGRVYEGSTVTYVAMQLAFHMGFNEVILIGVDHEFVTRGPPNSTVVSSGDDPDHFAPGYFGKGFEWQLPDLEGSEASYRMAREAYEGAGRRILDATVGGKLTMFPKVDYRDLF